MDYDVNLRGEPAGERQEVHPTQFAIQVEVKETGCVVTFILKLSGSVRGKSSIFPK